MKTGEDILKVLRRWAKWRKIEAAPDDIAQLEQRVILLEKQLHATVTAICPKCKQLELRPSDAKVLGGLGFRFYQCASCGFSDKKHSLGYVPSNEK